MLKSIRKSLTAGGDLYIADPTLQPGKQPICEETMSAEIIRKELLANGFTIVEERPIEGWTWILFLCKATKD